MNYYSKIKEQLINNEIYKSVKDYSKNRSDLTTYFNVGKLLVDAQGGEKRAKYGDGLIKEYSKRLTRELGKGYSERNLKNMRKFYLFQKGHALRTQLSWTHYRTLLSLNNHNQINYYIEITIKYNLSYRQLQERIKFNEYERLPNSTKSKLMTNDKTNITDFIKNPIIIKNNLNTNNISERILQKLILEDISSFLKELGDGFTFIDNEYKIKLGDRYNYIDLLLFNINFNCYVVVELKITELKAEHIGQIQKYMNYIDRNIRRIDQSNTIGIIIVRKDNKFIMEYCSDPKIFRTIYILK